MHTNNCTDYEATVQWQTHSWNVKRLLQSRAAAEAFLKQQVLVLKNDDPTTTLMEFINWKKAIATSLQIPEERMHTFALLDLISPSATVVRLRRVRHTHVRRRGRRVIGQLPVGGCGNRRRRSDGARTRFGLATG